MLDFVDELKSRWRSTDFEWGTENECFLGVGGYVLSVTGFDPVRRWRGKYNDEKSARALMEKHGLLDSFSEGMLRFQSIETEFLRRGDVAVVTHLGNEICTVFDGSRFCFKTPTGVFQVKRMRVAKAWRIKAR